MHRGALWDQGIWEYNAQDHHRGLARKRNLDTFNAVDKYKIPLEDLYTDESVKRSLPRIQDFKQFPDGCLHCTSHGIKRSVIRKQLYMPPKSSKTWN